MSNSKRLILFGLVLIGLVAGCGKKEASPAPVASPDMPAPPAVAAVAENAPRANVTGQTDAALTAQLQAFAKSHGRMPGNFTEFAHQLVSIPKPPAGTKWVIDTADQTVKSVSQ